MPTAIVTGSPDRVPDIAIALKSAGFDILAAGPISADDALDVEANSVDCYVQLPGDHSRSTGGALGRTCDAIAHELRSRFDTAARLLPLLAPDATVVLVTDGRDPADDVRTPGARPDQQAVRAVADALAGAIVRDCGRAGVRATVIGDGRSPDEIAALASHRPPEPLPWWLCAGVEPEFDFADWRAEVLCLTSLRGS